MKYIIGLIISIVMGATTYAQDNAENPRDSEDNVTANTGSDDSKVPLDTSSVNTVPRDIGKECALNDEFSERDGKFKEKKAYGNGNLEIEREKDGDQKVEFKSNTESYKYESGKNGWHEKYKYSARDDNSMIDVERKKNGEARVAFHGKYNSIEEAENAISQGLKVDNYGKTCLTGLTKEDHESKVPEDQADSNQ